MRAGDYICICQPNIFVLFVYVDDVVTIHRKFAVNLITNFKPVLNFVRSRCHICVTVLQALTVRLCVFSCTHIHAHHPVNFRLSPSLSFAHCSPICTVCFNPFVSDRRRTIPLEVCTTEIVIAAPRLRTTRRLFLSYDRKSRFIACVYP